MHGNLSAQGGATLVQHSGQTGKIGVPQDLIPTLVKPQASCEQACAESKAFNPSFQRNPPTVRNVSLQIVKGEGKTGNAKLVVDFRPDARLKDSLTIPVGDTPEILKRVSRTSYAGLIHFDFAAFEAELKRHDALIREEKTVPVFENRLLKRHEKLTSVNFDREADAGSVRSCRRPEFFEQSR
jgi:hypothetical protein